jgi:ABC-2 type transport system permease protein
MNTASLTGRQLYYENKSFWRNPAAAFFTFAFPLMFLVIFNLIFGNNVVARVDGNAIRGSTFYVPAIAAFSVITACFTNMSISMVFLRDEGVLKRVRGTPLPAASYLLARIIHATVIALLLVALVSLAGALFYGVDIPTDDLGRVAAIIVIGAAAFSALGLAHTAIVPNADAAPPVVNATILPLLFISDVFIPLEDAPAWLVTFAKIFPIWHYAHSMLAAFDPTGRAFEDGNLLVVAAWGVGGLLLALRFFSWEPRR